MTKQKNAPVVPTVSVPAVPLYEPILTLEEVAKRLRIKPTTAYELTRRDRNTRPLPRLKVGKLLRFRWSMVEKWLEER